MRETAISSSSGLTNPYLYTETYGEESKTVVRPPEMQERDSCGRGNESSLFLFDESTIAEIDGEDLNDTKNSIKSKDE